MTARHGHSGMGSAFVALVRDIRNIFQTPVKLPGDGAARHEIPHLKQSQPQPECAECEANRGMRGERPSHLLEIDPVSHESIGTALVISAFLIALGGAASFLFLYWTSGNNLLLGSCLAIFLVGAAAAFVFWAHVLTLKREVVEPRAQMTPPQSERDGAAEDFHVAAMQIHRRGLLKWMIAGGMSTVAAIVVSFMRSLGSSPDNTLYSTVWRSGQRLFTADGRPVSVNALQPGNTVIVFPEDSIGSEKAQTVLVRVEPQLLRLPSDRSDWAPNGNLAFSRVCTHAGCAVGMYETTTHQLMCPCHQSTFDVLRAAEPSGGPAARALPQLPLYVGSDGILRAGGGFSDIPGPGYWGMP